MTTTTHDRPLSAASDAYLAAVGAALVGVADSDRQELLDDLAEHLTELAPENDAVLIERLGPPEQYAAELLASAGIEPAASASFVRSKLVERVRAGAALLDTPRARRARAFWADLGPGWWVVRAWLVLAAIAARSGLQEALWIPNVTGKQPVDLALLFGAVVVSVRIGRGSSAAIGRWRKWTALIATAVGLLAAVSLVTADRSYFYRVNDQQTYSNPGTLLDPSGRLISNLFAYDGAGRPIPRFFLFDQAGVPFDVGDGEALRNNGIPFVSGLFPRPALVTNAQGVTRAVQPAAPAVSVPRLPQGAPAQGAQQTTVTTVPGAPAVTVPGAPAVTVPGAPAVTVPDTTFP